jgi:hypothetical protein
VKVLHLRSPRVKKKQVSNSAPGNGKQQRLKEVLSVQVGYFILRSPPASNSKFKVNTVSTKWGDRAEMDEGFLPLWPLRRHLGFSTEGSPWQVIAARQRNKRFSLPR